MKKKFLRILIGGLFCFSNNSYAQEAAAAPSVQFMATPTVASLAAYADTPVSHYAGTTSTTIPFFEINTGDYSLPITFSYKTGGIRLAEESSWIGLGWSLNAGGAITREIRDADDIKDSPYRGYLYNYGNYNKIHTNANSLKCEKVTYSSANTEWEDVLDFDSRDYYDGTYCKYKDDFYEILPLEYHKYVVKKSDVEPDIFMFNFGGYSGKFVLQGSDPHNINLGKGVLLNKEQNIAINFVNDPINSKFMATTPDGVVYEFDKIDKSRAGTETEYSIVSNSWLLTKIITKHKNEIRFDYERINGEIKSIGKVNQTVDYTYNYLDINSNPSKYIISGNSKIGLGVRHPINDISACEYNPQGYTSRTVQHNKHESHILRRISWNGGEIEFNTTHRLDYGQGKAKKLSDVKVYNKATQLIKTVVLKHEYFNNSYTSFEFSKEEQEKELRLKLVELQEISNSSSKPPYQFFYHEEKEMAPKDANSYDHWGYMNSYSKDRGTRHGATIPELYTYDGEKKSSYGGANRLPKLETTLLGSLKKIQYPTGGEVEYQYELNEFQTGAISDMLSERSTTYSENFEIWHYADKASELYDPIQSPPNYVDFAITDEQKVESFTLSFDIGRGFYDGILQHYSWQEYPEFHLGIYKLEDNNNQTLIKDIALHDFNIVWHPDSQSEPLKNLRLELENTLQKGTYRFKFFIPNYSLIPANEQLLMGNLTYYYKPLKNGVVQKITKQSYKAGGLRIKKITSPKNTREFFYTTQSNEVSNSPSSGKLLSNPIYYTTMNSVGRQCFEGDREGVNIMKFQTQSNIPVDAGVHGNIVGYSKVTEQIKNPTNGNKIKNVYQYHNNVTEVAANIPIFPSALEGKLITEQSYGNNNQLIKQTYSYYNHYQIENIQGKFVYNPKFLISSNNENLNSDYFIPVEFCALERQEQEIFSIGSETKRSIREISTFDYEMGDQLNLTTHRLPIKTEKFLEGEKKQVIVTYRPEEMLSKVTDLDVTQQGLMQDLLNEHQLNQPVQTMVYNKLGNVETLLSTSRIEYQKLSNDLIVPKYFKTSKGNNSLEIKQEYTDYDEKGNILEQKNKESGVYTSYIWSYNKTLPVAKIANATLDQVATALGKTKSDLMNFSKSDLATLNVLRESEGLKGAMITTYTYRELVGITSITDPRGKTIQYEYDSLNRLKYIIDSEGRLVSENEYYYKNQ